MKESIKTGFLGLFAVLAVGIIFASIFAHAATPEELRRQIAEQNAEIAKLEEEIAGYQKSLEETSKTASTLKNEVQKFNIRIKNLSAEINLTQKQINKKELEIEELGFGIADTEASLEERQKVLKNILRELNEKESESMVEIILRYGNLARFFDTLESYRALETDIRQNYEELSASKINLEAQQVTAAAAQRKLLSLRGGLADRRKLEEIERAEKDRLLKVTENREAEYQKLLKEKVAQKEEFEAELRRIESQLKYELDRTKIPTAGSGIFSWPLAEAADQSCYVSKSPAKNCITQYFGNTEFSRTAAYNGQGHNGVDFRASNGTPVTAALSGTVQKVSNGAAAGCQYGKWILVEHGNGLSTLYAHLSLVKASPGYIVSTGELIGYSGSTGYSTGPHLHFTVYVSEAVSFRQFTCKSGATVDVPVAPYSAYLNPLDYL